MSKKQTSLTTITPQDIAPTTETLGIWGAADNIGSEDLLVGKIFHQQALSKFVQDGKAQAGDWCDSLTGEVLAKKDSPLELIIFSSYKKLLISEAKLSNGKFDFVRADDVTPENCNLPWEEETATGTIKRQLQYNYFCLVPSKINELPYVLSLSSTKIKTAKKLNTMIAKLSRMKMPSAAFIFHLVSIKETGDKGSWFGADILQGPKANAEQLAIAHDWYTQIKAQHVIVAEEEHETPAPVTASTSSYEQDEMPY